MSCYYHGEIKENLPRVERSEVRYLYHSGFYDAPLSGSCLYNNERLWFYCFDENNEEDGDTSWWRKYVLLRFTAEQWEALDVRHGLFQDYVGAHTDYDEDGNRWLSKPDLKPRVEANHAKYYDWAKENPFDNYEGEQVAVYQI